MSSTTRRPRRSRIDRISPLSYARLLTTSGVLTGGFSMCTGPTTLKSSPRAAALNSAAPRPPTTTSALPPASTANDDTPPGVVMSSTSSPCCAKYPFSIATYSGAKINTGTWTTRSRVGVRP